MTENLNGFSLNVAAFLPFERYVQALTGDDAQALLKHIKTFDAQQQDAVAAIKIAKSYLEKRVAIAQGIADHDLFHDINYDALSYYRQAPNLTHADLIEIISLSRP